MQTLWERHCWEQKVSASTSPLLIPPRLLSPASVVHLQQAYFLSLSLFEWEKWKSDGIRCSSARVNSSSSRTPSAAAHFGGFMGCWTSGERRPLSWLSQSLSDAPQHSHPYRCCSSVRPPSPRACLVLCFWPFLTVPFFLLIYWQWNEQRMVLNSEWNFCK